MLSSALTDFGRLEVGSAEVPDGAVLPRDPSSCPLIPTVGDELQLRSDGLAECGRFERDLELPERCPGLSDDIERLAVDDDVALRSRLGLSGEDDLARIGIPG